MGSNQIALNKRLARTTVIDGQPHKIRGHHRAREEWTALIRDRHEPYIGWGTYERNLALIAENAQMKGLMAPRRRRIPGRIARA
jgi:hypothetical protein